MDAVPPLTARTLLLLVAVGSGGCSAPRRSGPRVEPPPLLIPAPPPLAAGVLEEERIEIRSPGAGTLRWRAKTGQAVRAGEKIADLSPPELKGPPIAGELPTALGSPPPLPSAVASAPALPSVTASERAENEADLVGLRARRKALVRRQIAEMEELAARRRDAEAELTRVLREQESLAQTPEGFNTAGSIESQRLTIEAAKTQLETLRVQADRLPEMQARDRAALDMAIARRARERSSPPAAPSPVPLSPPPLLPAVPGALRTLPVPLSMSQGSASASVPILSPATGTVVLGKRVASGAGAVGYVRTRVRLFRFRSPRNLAVGTRLVTGEGRPGRVISSQGESVVALFEGGAVGAPVEVRLAASPIAPPTAAGVR